MRHRLFHRRLAGGGSSLVKQLLAACLSSCALLDAASTTGSTITGTRNFQIVARLTGVQGSNSINPTWRVGIGGTDLGHMVNHRGKTYFLFGDTFASEASGGSGGPDWRQNAMAYSTDLNPADGITFDGWITRPSGTARQVIVPGNQPVTYIPTGAISVGDTIYAWYMHVTDWSDWTLDYAGLAKWHEGDSQFSIIPDYRFQSPAGGDYTTGQGTQGGNFGMVAASFRSPSENSGDEYLYIWGTPGGREGGVKLARVLPGQIEHLSSYRYFDGLVGDVPQWTAGEANGNKLVESGVGEMSVMYNEAVGAWTLMSISGGAQPDFEMRQASNPWGPWSDPITVAKFSQAPGLYAPYMNPLYVEEGGKTLYFTMSLWNPYDVYLAKVTLDIDDRGRWTAGDFNNDGRVDDADLALWRDGFGGAAGGDADNDGDSDGADLLAWQRNLGYAGGVAPQMAPEPSSWTASLIVLAMSTFLRRSPCARKRKSAACKSLGL